MSNPAQKRLDEMAKAEGFPNYAAMKAYKAKYQKTVRSVSPSGPKKKKNFLQSLMTSAFPATAGAKPALDAMNNATAKSKANRR